MQFDRGEFNAINEVLRLFIPHLQQIFQLYYICCMSSLPGAHVGLMTGVFDHFVKLNSLLISIKYQHLLQHFCLHHALLVLHKKSIIV